MLRLIENEQGNLENRWIPDEKEAPSDIKILREAKKGLDGWEQVEWMDYDPQTKTAQVNNFKKEAWQAEEAKRIADRKAANAVIAKPAPKGANPQISASAKKRLRAANVRNAKSFDELKSHMADMIEVLLNG